MKTLAKRAMYAYGIALFVTNLSAVSELRPVSSKDCVQVRYIAGAWMNPQGSRVAYVVKTPNLDQNQNDYQLYVRELDDETQGLGKLLITSTSITDVRWLGDGDRLTMLVPMLGTNTLISIAVGSGSQETLLHLSNDVEEYSTDGVAETVAYSVRDQEVGRHATTQSADEIADGYRVRLGESKTEGWPTNSIFIVHRQAGGRWSSPTQVSIEDPFTHQEFTHIVAVTYLSLSPNGKLLALNYWTDANLPEEWKKNPYVQADLKKQTLQRIMVIKNLEDQSTSLGFKNLYPDSMPLWSRDSTSFMMNAHSPIGSVWEKEDIRDHRTSGLDANLFCVRLGSGRVEEVVRHVPDHHTGPLFWRQDGDVIVTLLGDSVARMHHDGESWRQVNLATLPKKAGDEFWFLSSDGVKFVGVHQAIAVPENLFVSKGSQKEIHLLTDLNPELRNVRFADVRTISWTTADGLDITGLLFVPPDYVEGKRYPLVIQTKGDQGQFTCDSGHNHDPSFAPQPIAGAGIMYLARTNLPGLNFEDELAKIPKGYPGQLGFAAKEMHIWESAVDSLDRAGLIDPGKVGIIGFSATGFYVEFSLMHSRVHYAAATATDNEQGSIGEYWLTPTFSDTEEDLYGGPPYGETLENWHKYSISFNLDKIHTPLLMEEMGYGVHDDLLGQIPRNLAGRYEIYKGLTRLNKAVEMYYYPDEDHAPDHPRARLASLQRNVDWYRFWLQNFEDPDPRKKEQYQRWRMLRTLNLSDSKTRQNQNDAPSGIGP